MIKVSMIETWDFGRCVSVLTGEIELLKRLSIAQDGVRKAVMAREWTDFEEKTAGVNRMSEEFALLENERVRLFSALAATTHTGDCSARPGGVESKPFYMLIAGLVPEEGRELSRLYRDLKMATLKMRALNETFLAYLNEAKALAAAYLEAACPARGGKLYTRKGHRVSQDLRSIVFNNRF